LNPNDNQGVRYLYVNLLLELKDDERLEKLFRKYKNDWSACWKYSLALHEFRKKGNSRKAVKLLDEAIAFNPFVPDYLLGKKKLPKQMPPYYSPGDSTEAIEYLLEGMRPWVETEGALDWLKQFVEGDKGR
jgi:tetratricopeptide (TPR) repeat protein